MINGIIPSTIHIKHSLHGPNSVELPDETMLSFRVFNVEGGRDHWGLRKWGFGVFIFSQIKQAAAAL